MKKNIIGLSLLFYLLIALQSCMEEKATARSMEQIYAEEGVPVKAVKVTKQLFEMQLAYNAVLSGIQESKVFAPLGDRVEKIHVKVGDKVKKDQLLLSFPSDNPSANYFQAKVAFENSQKTLDRYENLYKTGGISLQTLDNIRTQFKVDQANWNAVRQAIQVKSPIKGSVTIINVRETENVKFEQALMTISNPDILKANVAISEKDFDVITKGTEVEARWNNKTLLGKVVDVDLAMDPHSKSFSAKLEFPNQQGLFRAGVTARLTIRAASRDNVIMVERKNLVKRNNGFAAFLADGTLAREIAVKTGATRGLYVEILDGLNEQDVLITEGQMFLEDGTKIKIID